jgi:tetratricopeptide (TPR) repeat protein
LRTLHPDEIISIPPRDAVKKQESGNYADALSENQHIMRRLFFIMLLSTTTLTNGVCSFTFIAGKHKEKQKIIEPILIHGIPVDSLFRVMQLMVYSNPDSVEMLASEALKEVQEGGHIDWQITMLNTLGIAHSIQSDYISAYEYCRQALNLAIQTNDTLSKGDTYNNLGGINFLTRNFHDALDNYLEAKHNYELSGNTDEIVGIDCNIGGIYLELNKAEKSLPHFYNAYNGFIHLNDSIGLTVVLNHMGFAFLKMDRIDSAIYYVDKSLQLSSAINDRYYMSHSFKLKADIAAHKNDYSNAVKLYHKSMAEGKKINNNSIICDANLGLSRAYLNMKMTDSSFYHAKLVLGFDDHADNNSFKQEAHDILSQLYEMTGDYKKSLEHYKLSEEIMLKMSDQSNLHQVYNLEIKRLGKEMEMQQLEIERHILLLGKRNSAIIIIILFFITVITILILIFSKIKHKQTARMNETLLKHAEERARAALDAELQERKRLGMELHDGIGPLISLAQFNVTALTEKPTFLPQENPGSPKAWSIRSMKCSGR